MRLALVVVAVLFRLTLSFEARAQYEDVDARGRVRERATLLAARLPEAIRQREVAPVVAPLTIGVGVLSGALYAGSDFEHHALLANSVLTLGGGVSYYFLPETHRNEVLAATNRAAQGTLYLWLAGMTDPGLDRSLYAIAGAYYGAALLEGLNAGLSRHPGVARLRLHQRKLGTAAARSRLTPAELVAIERDFLATQRPIPHWLVGVPMALGGGLGLVPAFDDDVASRERAIAAILGSATALQGLVQFAMRTPADEYQSDLVRVRLGAAAVSGGGALLLEGSF